MLWTIIVILVVLWLLEGSERIRFRPDSISSASSQSVLHPEDNSPLRSTGLHSANSVLGGMDHEATTSSKKK